MNRPEPSRKAALDDFLSRAADDLAQSTQPSLGNDSDGLLFLGAWHQSYPAILVRDPFLSDSAKVHFLYLMQESSQRPQGAIPMPSLEETARVLGQSRKTVGRDRMLLRVCRWISVCRTLRDGLGRFCGSIYAIHSEPCSLSEGSRLDRGYLDLLGEAQAHRDPYLQYAAQAALDGIDQALDEGRDPLDPPDSIIRRLNAAAAVQKGSGCFFDLLLTETKPSTENDADEHRKLESDEPKSYPQKEKFTHGQPWENFTHGKSHPCANFTHGDQAVDLKQEYKSYPQKEKFTHGYCSSSSNNTTTTTDKQTHEEKSAAASDDNALRWPTQFDNSQRAMISRAIVRENIPGDRQQEIVDVLAHKALDIDNPLRSPAGYAIKLCRRIKSGQFQPIAPPASTAPKAGSGTASKADRSKLQLRDIRTEMRQLHSEIDGLEQNLIPLAQSANQPALEATRDRYQAQLDELKQRYKALRDNAGGDPADDLNRPAVGQQEPAACR